MNAAQAGLGHPRGSSASAQLARLGFTDVDRVAVALHRLRFAPPDGAALTADPAVAELANTADPDQALTGLGRLLDALAAVGPAEPERGADQLRQVLAHRPGARRRLVAVLGTSIALADHLAAHPADWR